MDGFISTIIFTLPGLMCYYWLLWFGYSPSQKHSSFEMIGISALLWLPVSTMTLAYFNFISLVEHVLVSNQLILDAQKVIPFITNLDELQNALNNLWFLLFFIIFSVLFSYYFSRLWSQKIFDKLLNHINSIRENELKVSKLSKKQTVWEEVFIVKGIKVVKVVKLDNPNDYIIGAIRKTSRPLEPERNIALDEVDYFTKLVERYNPTIKNVFIDTKSGVAIYLYNPNSIIKLQNDEQYSNNPIISPWSNDE